MNSCIKRTVILGGPLTWILAFFGIEYPKGAWHEVKGPAVF